MLKELLSMAFVLILMTTSAQQLCENGIAAGQYPCENIDLYAHLDVADLGGGNVEMNDIWGWTDPSSGREFVVLGKTSGTSFIEITDPLNPIYLGDLATHTVSSLWRDVKVYDHYAFIVSEAGGHGMQVFDLEQLLTVVAPPVVFAESAHYDLFGNAHNIVINESVARAYAVGTNTFSGGLHIIDISDPLNPTIMGDYATDGYTHDGQVVTYSGPDVAYQGMEIAINCNEDAVTIANVDDPTDTQTLSVTAYANSSYTHQGWLTDDHTHLLVNDELDEANNNTNTRTFIFDVSDLNAPVFMGFYESTTAAIDHNHYVDKNLLYQANYRAGLRILDIQDVANTNVSEVAFFDLYPSSNSNAFNGAWSNYPYFPSGVLAVSHIESGLFLLRPQFVHATATEALVCFEDDYVIDISVEAGFVGPVALTVTQGLPTGAVATFSANNVGPGNYTLTLSNLPQAGGTFDLVVEAIGANFTYTDQLTFEVYDCVNDVLGCTDNTASNYNPLATIDDGTCVFPCIDYTLTILSDNYPEETTWTVTDENDLVVESGGPYVGDQTTFTETFCLELGCYTLNFFDTFGDGMQYQGVVGNYALVDEFGTTVAEIVAGGNFGPEANHPFCTPTNDDGCTNPAACNFDPTASNDDGSCILPDGCTNNAACNYNAAALCDDGSCILPDGCTNSTACNYNAAALCDDGSCILPDGCTNMTACNYNAAALCDDGSCILPDGCTDNTACNYNAAALCDDGSCILPDGCTNMTACNYNAAALCDDGSCILPDGCTNMTACNYNAAALCDDGSCILPDGCTDNTACNYNAAALCDDGSCILPDGCTDNTACNYNAAALCDDGSCILPDGCTDNTACNYNAAALCDDGSCILPDGCTDNTACNYNAAALCDDGSCILPDGCTNNTACNYNAAALCDDGSCILPDGCTDMTACNYNAAALCDDGSCILPDGCTDNTACNFDPTATCDDGSCLANCCPGDYDNNGIRNAGDLLALLGDFGCTSGCATDLNDDDQITAQDVLAFLGFFGTMCP